MHLASVFFFTCCDERLSETGRAAIINRQDGIASVSQPLMIAAIAEDIACPRTTMDDEHHRQRLGWAITSDVGRKRQIRNKGKAVARFALDGVHRREPVLFQLRSSC